jgi:hypothetical protein
VDINDNLDEEEEAAYCYWTQFSGYKKIYQREDSYELTELQLLS